MKRFSDLTEQEVLALAITNEEEDSRIYRGFSEGLREQFPALALESLEPLVGPSHCVARLARRGRRAGAEVRRPSPAPAR